MVFDLASSREEEPLLIESGTLSDLEDRLDLLLEDLLEDA